MVLSKVTLVMTAATIVAALAARAVALGAAETESQRAGQNRIVLTNPKRMDVVIIQRYVCQIHSRRHIDVCALENGRLDEIKVREGQAVKKGDLMFKIVPTLNKAKLDAALADVKAPFDGTVGRLQKQLGSLIKEGEILTTLSDNSVMWVYFGVPGKQYLEYMAARQQHEEDPKVELVLANGSKFPQSGKIGAIAAQFNNETENIAFRADFPNPARVLQHGQTGTILMRRKVHDAIVIPSRSTFKFRDKRYVFVVEQG